MVYPPTGSIAWEREMSISPKLHFEYYGSFTFTPPFEVLDFVNLDSEILLKEF